MAKKGSEQVIEGEWYEPTLTVHYEECCDCGLTHKNEYRIVDREGNIVTGLGIEIRCWVDPKRTKAARRKSVRNLRTDTKSGQR